jgi:hypothetical protein
MNETRMREKMSEGCSATRYGARVTVRRLWTDGLGRACVDFYQYAYGVRNECSAVADEICHSATCKSPSCPVSHG